MLVADVVSLIARVAAVRHHPVVAGIIYWAANACLVWYCFIVAVCAIGYVQLWRCYTSVPPRAQCETNNTCPHVTIIRPVKGLEPNLYDCLASTFRQTYPSSSLTIFFCVSDRDDPAIPIIQLLLQNFKSFDARLLIEEDDPRLQGEGTLGPNPKIRNMSRAYREAKGDIVWIIDCNVWVAKGTVGRMVDTLVGSTNNPPAKFVHLLPLVVDIEASNIPAEALASSSAGTSDLSQALANAGQARTSSTQAYSINDPSASVARRRSWWSFITRRRWWSFAGGRLEECFMSSSHAKFYTAINTVLIAPCIVGKSTMFRRSHLASLTNGQGIDFFADNICEDHLIGDLLWREKVPEEKGLAPYDQALYTDSPSTTSSTQPQVQPQQTRQDHQLEKVVYRKHAMVFSSLAIQPMSGMSVGEYFARRSRWLRVRKFTVSLATFVEPGTESFLCSAYAAFALTTLPFPAEWTGRNLGNYTAFWAIWLVSVTAWCLVDWTLYRILHSGSSVDVDEYTPEFAKPPVTGRRRPFQVWVASWLGRETLALPIWLYAVIGGTTVTWRGKKFKVGLDMKVREVKSEEHREEGEESRGLLQTNGGSKARRD